MSVCAHFQVHDVPIGERMKIISDKQSDAGWGTYGDLIACSQLAKDMPAVDHCRLGPNLLAGSVYAAFYKHLPLKFSAGPIWLTILQQFGTYINRHAEKLRGKFVAFQGKEKLVISRPDFKFRSPTNDYASVCMTFAELVGARTTPGVRDALKMDFSDSSAVDVACGDIALMDVAKSYFDYELLCGCGIPYIELLGRVEDWQKLQAKVQYLKQFACEPDQDEFTPWVESLNRIAGKFVEAAKGSPDLHFFGSVVNEYGASGGKGAPLTGWICGLFLYTSDGEARNGGASAWRAYEATRGEGVKARMASAQARGGGWDEEFVGGWSLDRFPLGVAKAPVKVVWGDVGKEEILLVVAGVASVHQHADGALEARNGWAVLGRPEGSVSKGKGRRGRPLVPRRAADFWADVDAR